ncbi:MAG: aminomethyl transferase family protein [Planctomycetes bacterium]|nr:aminomethyl transferase family protein [Planctomycetota bacterium]
MLKSSPFESVHEGMGAVFGEYDGWKVPASFGDVAAESKALQESCTVFDLCAFGRVIVTGQDASGLINGVFASDTVNLVDGKWIWAIICEGDGGLVDKARICRTGDAYMILTTAAKRGYVCQLVEEYARENGLGGVEIEDVTEKTGMLGLYGPKAFESVKSILPVDISGVEKGDIIKKSFFMIPLTMIRGSWLNVDGVELICPVSAAGLAAGAIAKYRDKANITPSGMECFADAMVLAGLPVGLNSLEAAKSAGPVELGFKVMVDFGKDFVGKAAVEKIAAGGAKSVLMGVKTQSKGCVHKDLKVQYDDKEIGFSDRISYCDKMGCCIGLALIDSEFAEPGEEIQIVGDDVVAGGELVKLPF